MTSTGISVDTFRPIAFASSAKIRKIGERRWQLPIFLPRGFGSHWRGPSRGLKG
jgi:hypothetical protein